MAEMVTIREDDLIETIAAIELPTAIAFLEFLKQRSSETIAKTDDVDRGDPSDAADDDDE